jgi:peroxiredoxin Q/BCP
MTADVGDPIPDIALETSEGGTIRPSDFRGRKLVLFFYPKDDTPAARSRTRTSPRCCPSSRLPERRSSE